MLADASPGFLAEIAARIGADRLAPPAPADLEEPRGLWQGRAAAVIRPRSTAEVAAVLRAARAARVGVVPRAGGTGLVGGAVAPGGPMPVILSVERLDRIRAVSAADEAMVVEAGVTLAAAKAAAEGAGRLFPLSLASEGSARIGGTLATNAGGVQVLRYGNARDLCLGVEAVLADGTVIEGLRRLRKDNTGYDLRHLLIGSEGTLGIITAAVLRLFPRPAEVFTAWAEVPGPEEALALLHALRARLGEAVSAFELIHRAGLDFLKDGWPDLTAPAGRGPWFVLVEAGAGAGSGIGAQGEEALAAAVEAGLAGEAVVAASGAQRARMWAIRETIPLANRRRGAVASHDISLPLSRVAGFIARTEARLAALSPLLLVNCFGHAGDGNLHYNVFPADGADPAAARALRAEVTEIVHGEVAAEGGSISAEHGIGRAKAAELLRFGDPGRLAAMRAIKRALDPDGILNPGAVLAE